MKAKSISILAILAGLTLTFSIGALSIQYQQQVWAPRQCAGCLEFKKLTHEFEKDVIESASIGDPGIIPALLEQYNKDVRALDLTPRG
ncbi:MAG TPA: hypothetical protein VH415_11130 [Nitrososphaeraceae archaeon]|jgi:hypothetical protein